jgi:hypothetical protein
VGKKIRIPVATVTYEDWWRTDAEDVPDRLELLERLLAKIGASELLVLPAGFVRVGTESGAKLRAVQIDHTADSPPRVRSNILESTPTVYPPPRAHP